MAAMQDAFPSPLADLRAYADGMMQTLGVARGLVDAGRSIDLAGLEHGIGLLCAKALDLPPEQGRAIRGELIALRARIESLTAALERARVTYG
jgi:hypothetical protein